MKLPRIILATVALVLATATSAAEKVTIAAASDLKYCLDEVAAGFRAAHPGAEVEVIYGSSGKFKTQIEQGAPFDLFFSADVAFAAELLKSNLAIGQVHPYAIGRIVLWSKALDASALKVADLVREDIAKVAIANPRHAPYGKRAEEALRASGVWEKIEGKLVYGENIAQTAQFAESGNAQVGIIALSLVLGPEMAGKGSYSIVPDSLHEPLEQGFVITARARENTLAHAFADYVVSAPARALMTRYGFALPGDASAR